MTIGGLRVGGLMRIAWLLSVLGLAAALVLPSPAMAQFKDDGREEEEATEEAEPDEDEEEEGDPADWEAAGLVSDTEFESPQYGYVLEWTDSWEIDLYYDQPENDLQPVMSDEETGADTVYLLWTGDPDPLAWLNVAGQDSNRGGVDEEVDEWTDPDYIEAQWLDDNPEFEVEAIFDDTTRDAAIVVYSLLDTGADDTQYYVIYMAVYLDDYTLYLSMTALEDAFEDSYAAVEEIEVDGDAIFSFTDWDDIEAAI